MKSSNLITAASVVLAVTVGGVLAVLVPSSRWTGGAICAAIFLCLSMTIPVVVPIRFLPPAGDGAAIWLIGPTAALWGLLFIIAAAALAFGLYGIGAMAWAGCIVWVGLLLASVLSLRAVAPVVETALRQIHRADGDERGRWSALVQSALGLQVSDDARKALTRLGESIRYAANGSVSFKPVQNEQIDHLLAELQKTSTDDTAVMRIASEVTGLLQGRELALKQSRPHS
jgi:hypothetical protein